ncbi:MAG TPA: cell surface protein SprA, partial [Anaerolineae bacterium]|nr:cell surface protein SprA [Anaerolineae bacterium]
MQKTLLGIRGEYDLFSDSRIGSVLLFKNETTKDRRVRLGQEPSRMFLFDTDAQFNFESRMATGILDKLPLLIANTPTKIRLETELAQSLPNMNTRGVVHIDDFEGSQNTPISIVRTNWTTASAPDVSTANGRILTRGRLQWYNPWNRVNSGDIWPNKETAAGENTVHVLNLAYGQPAGVPSDEGFAGVMQSFYGSGLDMSRSRFIEIWARGGKGELKIDLGSISEDFFPFDNPNRLLDTEDIPIPGQGHGDGILTKEEDTGLDGIFDAQEPGYGPDNPDPNNDDFSYKSGSKNDYSRINGTEGNASDGDRLGVPDTEDINGNGILDTRNSYYEYSISFEDPFDPYLVEDSIPTGDPHGWRLFRIPLWNNPRALVGGPTPPDSSLIEYARLWVTKTDSTIVQIASIEIVENNWLEEGIVNSEGEDITNLGSDRIRVSTINTHEDPKYSPPPGVKAEIDRETKIRRKEQSLVLKVENLQPGNCGFIYRNFEKMDFTDYTSLNMFVHGPDDFPTPGDEGNGVELIIRFGGDKINYYEYHTKIYRGWSQENSVEVDFARCTALKLLPGYNEYIAHQDSLSAVADTAGTKIYTLRGKPSLDNVKIISIGLKNTITGENLTGDVWVDELRMDSLRNMTGTAARVNVNADLSGFINLTARATRKSSDFHDMNSKKGTGQDNTEWNSELKVNLDRLTPRRWNLSLPVSTQISGTSALPRLQSGSDIILPDDEKKKYESTSDSKKYRLSYRKTRDSSLKGVEGTIIHWMFDKVNASYDWGERNSLTPQSGESISDEMHFQAAYDVDPKAKTFKPLTWLPHLPFDSWERLADMDLTYTPYQLNYNYSFNEKNQYKTNIDGVSDTTLTRTALEKYNFGYGPFKALRYNYTLSKTNDLYLKKEVKFSEVNN